MPPYTAPALTVHTVGRCWAGENVFVLSLGLRWSKWRSRTVRECEVAVAAACAAIQGKALLCRIELLRNNIPERPDPTATLVTLEGLGPNLTAFAHLCVEDVCRCASVGALVQPPAVKVEEGVGEERLQMEEGYEDTMGAEAVLEGEESGEEEGDGNEESELALVSAVRPARESTRKSPTRSARDKPKPEPQPPPPPKPTPPASASNEEPNPKPREMFPAQGPALSLLAMHPHPPLAFHMYPSPRPPHPPRPLHFVHIGPAPPHTSSSLQTTFTVGPQAKAMQTKFRYIFGDPPAAKPIRPPVPATATANPPTAPTSPTATTTPAATAAPPTATATSPPPLPPPLPPVPPNANPLVWPHGKIPIPLHRPLVMHPLRPQPSTKNSPNRSPSPPPKPRRTGPCPHGNTRYKCPPCGGQPPCQHGRRKDDCMECGNVRMCVHGHRRASCSKCKPKCPHGKSKLYCVDCGGKGLCVHGTKQRDCVACGGSNVCEHDKPKSRCRQCLGPKKRCAHGKAGGYYCRECGGPGLCVHGSQKHLCRQCGGKFICSHGKRRDYCVECGGKSVCEHNKVKYHCTVCKRRKREAAQQKDQPQNADSAPV